MKKLFKKNKNKYSMIHSIWNLFRSNYNGKTYILSIIRTHVQYVYVSNNNPQFYAKITINFAMLV